jgi:hypothetical protein
MDGHQELGVPFISVSAPSIVSGMSGESEKTLRETFEEAKVRLLPFVCGCGMILELPFFFFFAASSALPVIHRRD